MLSISRVSAKCVPTRTWVPALALLALLAFHLLTPNDSREHRSDSRSRKDSSDPDAAAVQEVLQRLIKPPQHEVGGLAICASLRSEGRWIQEWLLFHRAVGVDRFYLYDSGSTDDTLVMLQPWIEAGTVQLFSFHHDQADHYQIAALETCSRQYGGTTDWLLEADLDEFYVPTPYLTGLDRSRNIRIDDVPDQPVRRLLFDNWLYASADAIVVSRVSFKNAGYDRLPDGASVLQSQTLREFHHSHVYDKLAFTKSIVHSRKVSDGWIIPGAHFLKHNTLSPSDAEVITADGHRVNLTPNDPSKPAAQTGAAYSGQYSGVRVFEPLVMYHYVERDLQDCLRKLNVAQKLRKGGWRDTAGPDGCKGFDVYQESANWNPLTEKDSFYGGAERDLLMADSWFGRHLPSLSRAAQELARQMAATGELRQPEKVDPHPSLVAYWTKEGLSPINGMPIRKDSVTK